MRFLISHTLLTCLFLSIFLAGMSHQVAYAQSSVISGRVTEKKSGEPIPYVTIRYPGTLTGTSTDLNGHFSLATQRTDSLLEVSAIGFKKRILPVRPVEENFLRIVLEEEVFALREIEVRPGENPAHRIFRNIIAHKKENDPSNYPSWQSRIYTKSEVSIKNPGNKLRSDKLQKDFGFIFNYKDTTEIAGLTLLPVFFAETVSDFYHDGETRRNAEFVTAHKASGMTSDLLARYTGRLYDAINVYDNTIKFSDLGMISPLSALGLQYYRYYLLDSLVTDGRKNYELSFRPKLAQEPVFIGKMWVDEKSWALTKIEMKLSGKANVNFLTGYQYEAEFHKPSNLWVPLNESVLVDFELSRDNDRERPGFIFRKLANHADFSHTDVSKVIRSMKERIGVADDVMEKSEGFWTDNRSVSLKPREEAIYLMIDSVMNVPRYHSLSENYRFLFSGYRDFGKVEAGPWFYLYSRNIPEGDRIRLGGRTTEEFHNKFRLNGYGAYGFGDRQWKYGGGVEWWFRKRPMTMVSLQDKHDFEMLGRSVSALAESNIMTTMLGKGLVSKLNLIDRTELTFRHEWRVGIRNEVTVARTTIHSSPWVPFIDPSGLPVSDVTSGEVRLGFRFAPKEEVVVDGFDRGVMDDDHFILNAGITTGMKGFLGGDHNFIRLTAGFYDKIAAYPLGYGTCYLQAGKIFGRLPFPFLKIHEGNETYVSDLFAFNLMKYHEFVSDTYASLFYEHHFQGFFLNKIPLVRKLKWREVAGTRLLAGSLDTERHNALQLPEGMHGLGNRPYAEVSAGLENIFKFFRLDAVWRFSQTGPKRQNAGILFSMEVNF